MPDLSIDFCGVKAPNPFWLASAPPTNSEYQIRRAFEIVLNRRPRPEEVDKFSQFGGSLDSICRVLLNSNEFLYVE